jgi:hypothetical protein
MIAFEIFINGEKQRTIGGEDYSSFNVMLALLRESLPYNDDMKIELAASCITTDRVRIGTWPILSLAVGDRVEVRIVDTQSVDEPESMTIGELGDENLDE